MSNAQPRRRPRLAAVALGAVAATFVALLPATTAHAAASGTIAITAPANKSLAALTAKQVATITVTGAGATQLTEDTVASVGLGPTPCDALLTYVVSSPTTITVKTPATCPAGTGDVVITFTNGDSLTKTGGITFVTPPAIEALVNKPVINENSLALAPADQARRFSTAGGQLVRVKADPGYAFQPGTGQGASLAVSMGGKAGTDVKVYADDHATTPVTSGTQPAGNSMSFKTAQGMTAGDNTITLTQGGVSKTFLVAATGIAVVAAPVVTSLSVKEGKSNGTGISTVITGANFAKVAADLTDPTKWVVKFCDTAATVAADTPITGTTLKVTVPSTLADSATGLGATVFSGVCPVTVQDVVATQTSAITSGSYYTVLNE